MTPETNKGLRLPLVLISICAFVISADASQPVRLGNESWEVAVWPGTLRIDIQPKAEDALVLLPGRSRPGEVAALRQTDHTLQWYLPQDKVKVSVSLMRKDLSVDFHSDDLGTFALALNRGDFLR